MLLFHPLIIRLALYGGFAGNVRATAENGSHFFVDTVWLPLAPAYLQEGVLSRINKGEKIIPFLMFFEKSVIRVVFLGLPQFLDLFL